MSPGKHSPGVPAREYSEAAWQLQVEELLARYGWDWWYHTHDSRRSAPGMPDLVAVRRRDRRVLFAELKREGAQATPEQVAVLELMMDVCRGGWAGTPEHQRDIHQPAPFLCTGAARLDAYLWRPSDIDDVVEALR